MVFANTPSGTSENVMVAGYIKTNQATGLEPYSHLVSVLDNAAMHRYTATSMRQANTALTAPAINCSQNMAIGTWIRLYKSNF